jgi:hypothetical protein
MHLLCGRQLSPRNSQDSLSRLRGRAGVGVPPHTPSRDVAANPRAIAYAAIAFSAVAAEA